MNYIYIYIYVYIYIYIYEREKEREREKGGERERERDLILYSIGLCACFHADTWLVDTYSFAVYFEVKKCNLSCFVLLKIALTLASSVLPYEF
jgi:hypothetical protein